MKNNKIKFLENFCKLSLGLRGPPRSLRGASAGSGRSVSAFTFSLFFSVFPFYLLFSLGLCRPLRASASLRGASAEPPQSVRGLGTTKNNFKTIKKQ